MFRNSGIGNIVSYGQYFADNNALRLLDCRPHGNAICIFVFWGDNEGQEAFSVRRRERGVDRLYGRV